MAGFSEVAPYLTNPLVLVGFVLFIIFGVHRALLKAQIILPLTPHTGGKVVKILLHYGFVIALVVIVLGFALAFYQTHGEHDPIFQKGELEKKRLDGLTEMAKGYCQHLERFEVDDMTRRDVIHACAQAVLALSQAPDVPKTTKEDALARLEHGDAKGAKAIFREVLQRKTLEGKAVNKEAAEVARHLGALALYDNTAEALAAYRKAVEVDPDNPEGWNGLGQLLLRDGQLNDGEASIRKALEIYEALGLKENLAGMYSNLGLVFKTRGDLIQAEAMYKKALEVAEDLGFKGVMAHAYGNLGLVYKARGDLAQAEAMFRKALEVAEALGFKVAMANSYGNLGLVFKTRGDLAQAETMYKKALAIHEVMGFKEGVARSYLNLGTVYETRGDLVQAEAMYKKALAVTEPLGFKEDMGNAYGSLGNVYRIGGDLAQAEAMYKKALAIHEVMGFKEGVAKLDLNLGIVYKTRGDLVQAEAMYKKALAITEPLGLKEDMAIAYGNLGNVYKIQGDLAQAETMYKKSIALFNEIGATAKAHHIQDMLAALVVPRAAISHRDR